MSRRSGSSSTVSTRGTIAILLNALAEPGDRPIDARRSALRRERQRHRERAAVAVLAGDGDGPTVPGDRGADDGQPEAEAPAHRAVGPAAVELLEDVRQIGAGDADAA